MPITLLPASAAAFAPRSSCNVVLNSKVEPWLTATLKRINRIKRPLNSVTQHQRCLTETLSAPTAIWTLCSIMLPKAPDAELRRDDNPLIEALFNFQLLHIEAYVVHVDLVSQNEVAFKLTTDTIDALVEYHHDIFSVDTSASTWHWAEKEVQLKKLQDDFVQAANRFVFRAPAAALEGLEDDGAGELLAGGAHDAKTQILGLFLPLLPPPPRQPDVLRAAPILPSSTGPDPWWPSALATAAPAPPRGVAQPTPARPSPGAWQLLPASPVAAAIPIPAHARPDAWPLPASPSAASAEGAFWPASAAGSLDELQAPSPTPSYSPPPPFTPPARYAEPEFFAAAVGSMPTSMPASLAMEPLMATYALPGLPVESPCGVSPGFDGFGSWNSGFGSGFGPGFGGFGPGFDWERSPDMGLPFAMTI